MQANKTTLASALMNRHDSKTSRPIYEKMLNGKASSPDESKANYSTKGHQLIDQWTLLAADQHSTSLTQANVCKEEDED